MKIKEIIGKLVSHRIPFTVEGDTEEEITGFSSIYNYRVGTLSWLRHIETLDEIEKPLYYSCLITKTGVASILTARCQLWVDDPKDIFFWILDVFYGEKQSAVISSEAVIEKGAIIGKNVSIGDFTSISSNAEIGDNCQIGSNVTIKGKVHIGNNCTIQSGAIIGEDGFAFVKHDKIPVFVKHYGGVTLENNVSIGAQTCICRGAIDDTLIKEHVKIDNLCHVAHNVVIGKRTIIIANSVIMGSVHIGDDCWISTCIIRDQRKIGNNCVVGMGSVVVNSFPDNVTVAGNPAVLFKRNEEI